MKLSRRAQIALLTVIYRLSRAGISMADIAIHLTEYGNTSEKTIGSSLTESIESGKRFSPGLKQFIDPLAYESVAAGEYSGQFTDGLLNALETLKTQSASGLSLLVALLKPLGALMALLYGVGFLGTQGIPKVIDMIPAQKRHGAGMLKMVESFGVTVDTYLLPVASVIAALILLAIVSAPVFTGQLRAQMDNLPIFRQYRLIQAGNFLGSLANITKAGHSLKDSLEQLFSTAGPYMQWHIGKMLDVLESGQKNIGSIVDTGLLNAPELRTIVLLGEIGEISDTLQKSSEIHREILKDQTEFLREYGISVIKILVFGVVVFVGAGFINFLFSIIS